MGASGVQVHSYTTGGTDVGVAARLFFVWVGAAGAVCVQVRFLGAVVAHACGHHVRVSPRAVCVRRA